MDDKIIPTPRNFDLAPLFSSQIYVTNPTIISIVTTPAITNPSVTNPSGTNPSGTNPSGTNPSGTNPSGTMNPNFVVVTNPSGTNPSGTNPSGTNPSGTNPSGTNSSGTNPSGTNPSGTNPVGLTRGPRKNMGLNNLPGETKIGDIINNEVNRLKTENNSVSNSQQDKTRLSTLNDSYRKRYLDYIKIMIVIVIGLLSIWFLTILENMQIIPSFINNFLIAGIVSITVIICNIIYNDIQKHNLLNYDELSIKSPDLYVKPISDPATSSVTMSSSSTTGTSGSTIQCPSIDKSQICGNGTTYDKVSQKCVSGASALF